VIRRVGLEALTRTAGDGVVGTDAVGVGALGPVVAPDATVEEVWDVLRWPLGLGALVPAVTALFRYCPRRQQPGLSCSRSAGADDGDVVGRVRPPGGVCRRRAASTTVWPAHHGPLTAMIALLLWANVTGIVLLGGVAVAAQPRRCGPADRSRCPPTATTTAFLTARRALAPAEPAVVSPGLRAAGRSRVMRGDARRLICAGLQDGGRIPPALGRRTPRAVVLPADSARVIRIAERERRTWGHAASSGFATHHQ
jgi:hypothetical protein